MMKKPELDKYAEQLYARIDEAFILKCARIDIGDWKPELKKCHDNVTYCCQHLPGYKPARGWRYVDLNDSDFVEFWAHSAIIRPTGEIRDITPSNLPRYFPFILSRLPEDEYISLICDKEIQKLTTPRK